MKNDNELYIKYNTYAYMIWNFLETVYDISDTRKRLSSIDKVWFPVLIEENKLHYSWFKKNPQLFRQKFQNYIHQINSIKLSDGSDSDFRQVLELYEKDFPETERKTRKQLLKLYKECRNYKLIVARHPKWSNNEIVGYAFVYKMRRRKIFLLDYFAIAPQYRSCGFGSEFIETLLSVQYNELSMVFEIEDTSSGGTTDAIRRKKFYQRLGAKQIPIDYYMPSANGKEKMELMVIPGNKTNIVSGKDISALMENAIKTIHSDYPHTESVINGYINRIPDVKNSADGPAEIIEGSVEKLDEIYQRMEEDFPLIEKISKQQIKTLLEQKKYKLILVIQPDGRKNDIIGYAFIYETTNHCIFVDYLAISRYYQRKGYGTLLVQSILEMIAQDGFGLMYERIVSIDDMPDKIKSFDFEASFCARKLGIKYMFPDSKGTLLELAIIPKKGQKRIEQKTLQGAIEDAISYIHSDYDKVDEIIDGIINHVNDVVI